jgi:hypothetical protein
VADFGRGFFIQIPKKTGKDMATILGLKEMPSTLE